MTPQRCSINAVIQYAIFDNWISSLHIRLHSDCGMYQEFIFFVWGAAVIAELYECARVYFTIHALKDTFFFQCFFFGSSDLVIFIALSSGLLILSSVSSNILLSPFSVLFIAVILFFKSLIFFQFLFKAFSLYWYIHFIHMLFSWLYQHLYFFKHSRQFF